MFDRTKLLDQFGGDRAFLAEIVRQFFGTDLPANLVRLRGAIEGRDGEAIARCAHTIKGALLNFHAPAAVEAAHALEACAESDDATIATKLADLERIASELEASLRAEVE